MNEWPPNEWPGCEAVPAVAVYRYQVVSVGWWRGKIKRWNTTFHMTSSTQTGDLHNAMQDACYPNPGDVTGDCSGGVASIAVYNAAGGAPISQSIYFDWATPGEWIPFDGTAWESLDPQPPLDASGESAAVIVGHMSGLSASGKPVTTRKYLHAVPSRTAADYADPDIDATCQAALVDIFNRAKMCNPAGSQPGEVTCEAYYLNHQRVRGRRRPQSQLAGEAYAAGVVTGAGAAAASGSTGGFGGGGSF